MKPLLLALQFLTRLPLPTVHSDEPREFGRSMLYYPLVGLLIGLLLAGLNALLGNTQPMLNAALLLITWILVTGALHLDGLADSADAWLGGHGDRERTLAIMKDPYCGPAAVVILICVLLGKFAALTVIVTTGHSTALIIAPLLARVALTALFLTTPYVRQHGLGSALAEHLPRRPATLIISLTLLACLLWPGIQSFWPVTAGLASFLLMRHLMCQRIGGTTGDTAGAMVEIMELVCMVGVAIQMT